jgi:hypothetical protein
MSDYGQSRNGCSGNACQRRGILLPVDKDDGSSTGSAAELAFEPLWTPEQVAQRLNVSPDWVRDHSSRKEPRLPVIRLGGGPGRAGLLRYRASQIEKFLEEMERLSTRDSRRI